jgi:hypothetical protein
LDDYEEGTWTPATVISGFTESIANFSGTYTKIGKVVVARMILNLSSSGRPTSYSEFSGLPFTADAASDGVFGGSNAGSGIQGGTVTAASTSIFWYQTNGAINSVQWHCTVTYFV